MWHAILAFSLTCTRLHTACCTWYPLRAMWARGAWSRLGAEGPVVLSHVSCQGAATGAAWVSLETLWRCMCFVYVYNSRLVHSVHVWDVSNSVCKIKRAPDAM